MHFPTEGFFKLIEERLGRWVSTGLLVLAVLALAVGFLAIIVNFGVLPVTDFVRRLLSGQPISSVLGEFLITIVNGLIFGLLAWVAWRLIVGRALGRLETSIEGFQRDVVKEVEVLRQRVARIEGQIRPSGDKG